MYEIIIRDYVNKLTEDDIIQYSKRKNISLNDDEVKVLYLYAKNYWREFYKGNPNDLILELKEKLRPQVFDSLYKIYTDLKDKLNWIDLSFLLQFINYLLFRKFITKAINISFSLGLDCAISSVIATSVLLSITCPFSL